MCTRYRFFFFFKQKTAYEMRISDWSSDVCSSDLTCPLPVVAQQQQQRERDEEREGGVQHADPARRDRQAVERDQRRRRRRQPPVAEEQIGRASCRERVGQYV